ncbi:MAG TPA: ROK family protein [Polyangia bacterium]|nr:ROK family protein [Polyangia bacterium]
MRIGIDVGGTKIEGILLGDGGRELARERVATPAAYARVLAAIGEVVGRLDRAAGGGASVGVGTPGYLQPGRGLIRNANLLCLNDQPLDRDLAAALGRPVRLANDAKCFVLSEATDGAAAPPPDLDRGRPDVVFGATLGTGVGGGMVVDGRVLLGENGAATEWSHTTLPFTGPDEPSPYACFCGRPGCIESFISGRGLEATYRALGGGDAPGGTLAARAEQGDAAAARAFALYEDRLARALASVINLVDPRAIVLGGGVSNNRRLFANVPRLWERYTVARDLRTRLLPAAHGDASGVRGAALL